MSDTESNTSMPYRPGDIFLSTVSSGVIGGLGCAAILAGLNAGNGVLLVTGLLMVLLGGVTAFCQWTQLRKHILPIS